MQPYPPVDYKRKVVSFLPAEFIIYLLYVIYTTCYNFPTFKPTNMPNVACTWCDDDFTS